ncbi:MAG: Gfo/Idh/MocA family oxidoreductase [Clostridiales bacterium]|nr:Gfo/Idh/MocA family oxidoreductase [Clostridiales bacterium]
MNEPVSLVLVGIGGMGSVYLEALLDKWESGVFRLAGAVDPEPERCPHIDKLHLLGVQIFEKLEDFYARERAQLAIISSPIQFHPLQTRLALAHRSHVLCEKPVAATIQEARDMLEAKKEAGKHVAIGYQWSFSSAIQRLKKDIKQGIFGRPKRLKCLYLWPRDEAYYRRNDWAGKKRDSKGRWILDSPANNAMAHDLHNMFYILGKTGETSALPARVEAELYRAYDIENFDTGVLRCFTEEGTEILFYVSHACEADTGPVFRYEFEAGAVEARGRNADIKALLATGEAINYGNPDSEPLRKMWEAMDCAKRETIPACGIEAAVSQTLCLNGAQESMPEITNFPFSLIKRRGEPGQMSITVKGLEDVLGECYEKNLFPSELGVSWSKKGKVIDLTHYRNFPGG